VSFPRGENTGVNRLMLSYYESPMKSILAMAITLLLAGTLSATDDKPLTEELLAKARTTSDIRADGSTPFRMEGIFEISAKDAADKVEGTYIEIWVSSRQWRREVQTSSFHRIEIRHNSAIWVADSGSNQPEPAFYDPLFLLFPTGNSESEAFRISERQLSTGNARCVESNRNWTKSTDCIDPTRGTFIVRETLVDPFNRGSNTVRHSCEYSAYEKFGDKIFPRVVLCNNDPGKDIQLKITKLVAESSPEEALFVHPPDAIQRSACAKTTPPRALSNPDPHYPAHHKEAATVVISTLVGDDGTPEELKLVSSAGSDFDQAALDAVREWKFKPSTCDGTPIPARINIEIKFNKF
jgi:TonB family protein